MFGSEGLHRAYDVAMLDLDGVVYHGERAIPGVADELARARAHGLELAFITNNASRAPHDVAAKLTRLGVPATTEEVVTSSQAAARLVVQRFGPGARIAVLGSEGLQRTIAEAGLVPVPAPDEGPLDGIVAVVSGFGPQVRWSQVIRMAVAIKQGLPWVAANGDLTFPAEYGIAPGHGALVRLLAEFSGVTPQVAGKPEAPLLVETIARTGAQRPLMVGDRFDTDIEGAVRLGIDSMLVLTGVSGLTEVLSATAEVRPTYLAPTLAGLVQPMSPARVGPDGTTRAGGWRAEVIDGVLRATEIADQDAADRIGDWWRAMAAAAWTYLDATGRPADVGNLAIPG